MPEENTVRKTDVFSERAEPITTPPVGWIPATQAATLLRCTARTIRNRIIAGGIVGRQCLAPSGQAAYYVDPAADPTLAAIYLPEQTNTAVAQAIARLSQSQRKRGARRLIAVEAWRQHRDALPPKQDVKTAYRKWALEHYIRLGLREPPSWPTMWRWCNAAKLGGLAEVAPKNTGSAASEPSPEAWAFFQTLYLDGNRRYVRDCWRQTKVAAQKNHWKWISYQQCLAKTQRDIPEATRILYREGNKALDDKCTPYIERAYDMPSNAWWVVDHHQLDVAAIGPQGKPIFPWLTYWQDVRSRKCVGMIVSTGPCLDVVLASLRRAMLKYGVPQHIYFDNGKEFRSRQFSGGPARRIKYDMDSVHVRASLSHLPVECHFANPYNAKAKTNERTFRTLRMQFSQQWATYRGNNVTNRPEGVDKIIRNYDSNGLVPAMGELESALVDWVETVYAERPHKGRGMNSRTPNECYRQELREVVRVQESELTLLMMRTTDPRTVGRNGISLWGRSYHSPELFGYLKKRVYARFDPNEVGRVYIFDMSDRFICIAERKDLMSYGATHEDIQQAMHAKARYRKMAQSYAEHSALVSQGDVVGNIARQRQAAEAERAERPERPTDPDGGQPHILAFRSVLADAQEAISHRLAAAAGGPEPVRRAGVREFLGLEEPEIQAPKRT
ncbi:MAG: Mu transposase C-terminal domain-containing protein [Phycisphaerae bacterium]|nr:Mu transposase C-terminal domain-containing protein [Phycisphaerae bacterium]